MACSQPSACTSSTRPCALEGWTLLCRAPTRCTTGCQLRPPLFFSLMHSLASLCSLHPYPLTITVTVTVTGSAALRNGCGSRISWCLSVAASLRALQRSLLICSAKHTRVCVHCSVCVCVCVCVCMCVYVSVCLCVCLCVCVCMCVYVCVCVCTCVCVHVYVCMYVYVPVPVSVCLWPYPLTPCIASSGRASSAPVVDVFVTLLHIGADGYTQRVRKRKVRSPRPVCIPCASRVRPVCIPCSLLPCRDQ